MIGVNSNSFDSKSLHLTVQGLENTFYNLDRNLKSCKTEILDLKKMRSAVGRNVGTRPFIDHSEALDFDQTLDVDYTPLHENSHGPSNLIILTRHNIINPKWDSIQLNTEGTVGGRSFFFYSFRIGKS